MKDFIPHSRPNILPIDIEAVTEVLESGMLIAGDKAHAFEDVVAAYINRNHAAVLSSGTAAIYSVLSGLGIGTGDDVIIPAYVCSSLLYAVRMSGASPVIADSGDDPFHMDRETVKRVLTKKTKVVLFPHLFGAACDISGIIELGVPVIEDCALSLGSALNGVKTGSLGSCAAVCSFYATKVIAAGEGGMVLSDDLMLVQRIRDLVEYDHKDDGHVHFNFKMTDINAALGLSQFRRIDSFIKRRRLLASLYSEAFAHTDMKLPAEKPGENNIFYRYVIRMNSIEKFRQELQKQGIMAERPVFKPLSLYSGLAANCPRAEETWNTSLSIPLYPALTDNEADTVIKAVINAVENVY